MKDILLYIGVVLAYTLAVFIGTTIYILLFQLAKYIWTYLGVI